MGDRVVIMRGGAVQQVGPPQELYDHPRNLFVAGFIGSPAMNLMEGSVSSDGVQLGDYTVPVAREILAKAGNEKTLVLGIRPENFELSSDQREGIGLDIGVVEELGADAFIYGTLAGIPEDELITAQQLVARIHGRVPPHRGETVRLQVDREHVHVFSKESGLRISEWSPQHLTPPPPR